MLFPIRKYVKNKSSIKDKLSTEHKQNDKMFRMI